MVHKSMRVSVDTTIIQDGGFIIVNVIVGVSLFYNVTEQLYDFDSRVCLNLKD